MPQNSVWQGSRAICATLSRVYLQPEDMAMIYHEHKDYDRAIATGIRLASQFGMPLDNRESMGARVFYDPATDDIGACTHEHTNYRDQSLETVAYIQRWDKNTLQVRENGATSTFVKG